MEQTLFALLHPLGHWAIALSLLVNVIIALLGVVPSWAVTAVNIALYGPVWGGLLSAIGEALGAVAAFALYRRGFRPAVSRKLAGHPRLHALRMAPARQVATGVLLFRLVPWVPSGLVTFAAAVSELSFGCFVLCSSLGKIPALIIEVMSVYYALHLPADILGAAVLLLGATALAYHLYRRGRAIH